MTVSEAPIAERDDHAGGADTGHAGHAHHQGDHAAEFRDRFWISLVLSLPVVFCSTMVQHWFGYSAPSFPGDGLVAPVLGTVVTGMGAGRS